MREQFIALYEELVKLFSDKNNEYAIRKAKDENDYCALTCIPEYRGDAFNENRGAKLMIVGRAVNGWDTEWQEAYQDIAKQALAVEFDMKKHIDFNENNEYTVVENGKEIIKKYNYNRCAFIQLGRNVVKALGIDDDYPASHLLWTNLYKVAPALGGNPNGKVQAIQRSVAIKILKKEIDEYKPTHILFVTDLDWLQFTWKNDSEENTFYKEFGMENSTVPSNNEYVKAMGKYNSIPYIVCVRPEKRRRDEISKAVISAFYELQKE